MGCCKTNIFNDYVSNDPGDIRIYGVLAPDSDYFWEVTDQHRNVYLIPFTTDADGLGSLDVSQLPEGFFNPFISEFTIRVKSTTDSCDYEQPAFIKKVDSMHVNVVKSNVPKETIGCPIDIKLPEKFSSERFQFTGEEGQTQYPLESYPNFETLKSKIRTAKQILVFNEMGILQEGDGETQYQVNLDEESPDWGIITFGQAISGQTITIIIFK